jgi:uncharacterized protein
MPTALITGASSGIGAAFARTLAGRGHALVLVARDTERLEAAAESLRSEYAVEVEVLPADLSDRADVARVAERVADADRPVDLLVNNAGFGLNSRLTGPDLSEQERALNVMCRAVLLLSGAAGRAMRERGSGAIVNVSSLAGFFSIGGYSAVKAWVTAYTEALAVELAGTGVTATAVCPGFVHTEFHDRADLDMSMLPAAGWTDVEDVVRLGLRDAARGRVVSVPTLRYRTVSGLARHAPRAVIRRVSRGVMAARKQ